MNTIDYWILITLFVSMTLSACFIYKILQISFQKGLFDEINERKVHTHVVPRLGGVAFVPAIIISSSLTMGLLSLLYKNQGYLPLSSSYSLIFPAIIFLYVGGFCDDLIGVGYKWKFAIQIACSAMIVGSGLCLDNLHGLFGFYQIPMIIGFPLTILLIVFLINAINLIDGIDGLAASLSLLVFMFCGVIALLSKDVTFVMLITASVGALSSFLYYNFSAPTSKKKIFMGDTGSQILGFLVAIVLIRLCLDGSFDWTRRNPIPIAFALVLVPSLDVFRVMLSRIREKRNPFKPDSNHFHHKILQLGFSHRQALFIILLVASSFVLLNVVLADFLDTNFLILFDIALWTVMNVIMRKRIGRICRRSEIGQNEGQKK